MTTSLLFWLSSKANSSLGTIFFLGMMKFFDTFCCVILKSCFKKKMLRSFPVWNLFTTDAHISLTRLMKYGYLTLPGASSDKVNPDIDFANVAVVQCNVPIVQIRLLMMVIYKESEISFDVNEYLNYSFWKFCVKF